MLLARSTAKRDPIRWWGNKRLKTRTRHSHNTHNSHSNIRSRLTSHSIPAAWIMSLCLYGSIMAYGPHTFAYPAQLNWQEKIKTQRVASDAFNGRRAGAIGCRRKCRRGKSRECGCDWETGSLLLAFVDLLLFLLSLLLLLSLYPLPLLFLLLLLPMLSLIIPLRLLFLLLLILLLLLHVLLIHFPMFFCFAALSATLGLPASPTLLLPQLPLLSTSPTPSLSHYTISRLHFLPVMRVLQQPRTRPLITKALTTCCRHQPTRLAVSQSVKQSRSTIVCGSTCKCGKWRGWLHNCSRQSATAAAAVGNAGNSAACIQSCQSICFRSFQFASWAKHEIKCKSNRRQVAALAVSGQLLTAGNINVNRLHFS